MLFLNTTKPFVQKENGVRGEILILDRAKMSHTLANIFTSSISYEILRWSKFSDPMMDKGLNSLFGLNMRCGRLTTTKLLEASLITKI